MMIRRYGVLALALLGSARTLGAQTNADDPWNKMPPLPTTCYADHEFSIKLANLYAELGEQKSQQEAINTELGQKAQQLDPMEMVRRLNEFMARDPQKAMKFMQAQAAAAGEVSSGVTSSAEAKEAREAELVQLSAEFKAANAEGAKPFLARQDELVRTSTRPILEGAAREFTSKAAQDAFDEQVRLQNADYEARCAAWYGADGKLRRWLASYRSTVIDPMATTQEEIDGNIELQMAIMGTSGDGFRSTAQIEAVREYARVARILYDLRLPPELPWAERR
jgi:hypothetical protein